MEGNKKKVEPKCQLGRRHRFGPVTYGSISFFSIGTAGSETYWTGT